MQFGYKKKTALKFNEVLEKIPQELLKEGFGIITEIDARATFKKKLDIDFEDYKIFGACHPKSAFEILNIDKELGLLLPCNVIVYKDKDDVFVCAILPSAMIAIIDNEKLSLLAKEIEEKLKKVINNF